MALWLLLVIDKKYGCFKQMWSSRYAIIKSKHADNIDWYSIFFEWHFSTFNQADYNVARLLIV